MLSRDKIVARELFLCDEASSKVQSVDKRENPLDPVKRTMDLDVEAREEKLC